MNALPLHIPKRPACIIGNLNIDLIIRNVPRMPEWGQEVLGDDYLIVSSGQAAYTAFALKKLGVPTGIIGNVGDDLYGSKILNELSAAGVDIAQVEKSTGGRSGISVAIVRPDGERAFVSDTACLKEFDIDMVKRHEKFILDSSLVLMDGLFFLPGLHLPDLKEYFVHLKEREKTLLLDTGWDPGNWQPQTIRQLADILAEINIFIPNMDEASAITGYKEPEKAAIALREMGPKTVIIKMGSEGSYAFSENEYFYAKPHTVKVHDAVGAGDVFNAGFIFSLLHGWPLQAGMEFGNSAAAAYISKQTNRFPAYAEVAGLANSYHTYQYPLKSEGT
jgi:ribokinase